MFPKDEIYAFAEAEYEKSLRSQKNENDASELLRSIFPEDIISRYLTLEIRGESVVYRINGEQKGFLFCRGQDDRRYFLSEEHGFEFSNIMELGLNAKQRGLGVPPEIPEDIQPDPDPVPLALSIDPDFVPPVESDPV